MLVQVQVHFKLMLLPQWRPTAGCKSKFKCLEKELKDTKEVLDHVLANAFKRKKKAELGEKPTKKNQKR